MDQDVFQLTRTLIDIESITPNEREIGQFLFDYLNDLAQRFNGEIERLPVEPGRDNVFVRFGKPIVTLSTHMDTVPPFIPSREDGTQIWGRGACDTKGIIASMLLAAENFSPKANATSAFSSSSAKNAIAPAPSCRRQHAARQQIPHQWRTHRKSARPRLQRRAPF